MEYSIKKEYELILKAVLINKKKSEKKAIDVLLEKKLDWIEIAGQLYNHRLSGYFLLGISEEQQKRIPDELRKALYLTIDIQRQITLRNIETINSISNILNSRNIRYSLLKGCWFDCYLYIPGCRRSNDMDILVYEEDLDVLDKELRKLGYIQSFNMQLPLVEASRKEKVIQRLYHHDLVPYVKCSQDRVDVLDINFLFDEKSNPIEKKVFMQYINCDTKNKKELVQYANLCFLCTHFYREAQNEIWTKDKRDLRLYKVVDIINTLRYYGENFDVGEFINVVDDLNIRKKCQFTFCVLSSLCDEQIIRRITSGLFDNKEQNMKESAINYIKDCFEFLHN